jgi:hypothetical protein
MDILKSKNYSNVIPLSELKEHLHIIANDNSTDGEVLRLLKSAIATAEKQIQGDIVPTVNQLEDYCIYDSCYTITEPRISISAITVTTNIDITPIVSTITDYRIIKGSQYTTIKFKNWISADKINIVYTSGYNSSIPDDIKLAIAMLVSRYFSVDRDGYVANINESRAIERLLAPYSNILY